MKENQKNIITRLASWVTLVVALLFVAQTGRAQVVFNNLQDATLTSHATTFFSDTNQFGDDILLKDGVGAVLTNFAIQFYATNLPTSGATMELKLYANDGTNYGKPDGTNLTQAYPAPNTLIYDSGMFKIVGIAPIITYTGSGTHKVYTTNSWGGTLSDTNCVHTITFDKASMKFDVYVPSNFTWTVQFAGLGNASVGLVMYDPTGSPAVGTDYLGFWEANGGAWAYRTNSSDSKQINFGAKAIAATIMASNPPTFSSTSPANKFTSYTEVIPVSGKVTPKGDANNAIQFVKVRVGTSSNYKVVPVVFGGLGLAVTYSTTVDLGSAGPQTNYVVAVDAANVTATNVAGGTFVINTNLTINLVKDGVTENSAPDASILLTKPSWATKAVPTPPVTGPISDMQIAKVYTVKLNNSPKPDYAYFLSNVVSSATGDSGYLKPTYTYSFPMTTNLVLNINYCTNRFVSGTYNGLFGPASGSPEFDKVGSFTLTSKRSDRTFSGSLAVNGNKKVSFKGTFSVGGVAATTATNATDGAVYALALTNKFDGTIAGTVSGGNNGWTNLLLGDLQGQNTSIANWYTFAVEGNHADATFFPGGDTTATVKIDATGKATISGYFGDNTAMSAGLTPYVAANGRLPLCVLGGTNEVLWGWLQAGASSLANNTLVGWGSTTVSWIKKADYNGSLYSTIGFSANKSIVSSLFTPSAPPYVGLTAVNGTNTGTFAYSDAGGTVAGSLAVIEISSTGKIQTKSGAVGSPDSTLAFTALSPSGTTGSASKTFKTGVSPSVITYTYKGVVLQNQHKVVGEFPAGLRSGYVLISGMTFTNIAASPSLAKEGTVVYITFAASATLSANPTVTVNTHAAVYVSNSGNDYTYSYTVQASDIDGSAVISISGTGQEGEAALARNTTALVVDKTAPAFTSIAASPSLAKQGTNVTITFTASETLSANPTVTVNTHDAVYVSNSGNTYTYSYTVQASDADGDATIAISGTDPAGNLGSASSSTALDVDKTAPTFTSIAATPPSASVNTYVYITFTASETLSAIPTVTVNTHAASKSSNSGNNYTYKYKILALDPSGAATIAISGTDPAGNSGSVNNTTALTKSP